MARAKPPPEPPEPTAFMAECLAGPEGAVEWWGGPLSEEAVISRLGEGRDVVVRGPTRRVNRTEAQRLAVLAFGGSEEDQPHGGRMSLPHFHPEGRSPEVPLFFDAPPSPYARQRKPQKPKKSKK